MRLPRQDRYYLGLTQSAISFSEAEGVRSAATRLGVSVGFTSYWYYQSKFHTRYWGGSHNYLFPHQVVICIEHCLWILYQTNPSRPWSHYVRVLKFYLPQINVPYHWIRRIFKSWNFSWKKPERRQIEMFTAENIAYYSIFCIQIANIPTRRIHYFDESHFDYRDFKKRLRVCGMRGDVIVETAPTGLFHHSYTLLLVTTLTSDVAPFYFQIVRDSCTRFSVARFLLNCLERGAFRPGDYLILDGAATHANDLFFDMLCDVFRVAGVTLVFQPKYSPELNAAELVFGHVKKSMQWAVSWHLLSEILSGLSTMTTDMMEHFYNCAINKWRKYL